MSNNDTAGVSVSGDNPNEPGWYHRAGDPVQVSRWWTGAGWTDYTKADAAVVTSAVGEQVTQGVETSVVGVAWAATAQVGTPIDPAAGSSTPLAGSAPASYAPSHSPGQQPGASPGQYQPSSAPGQYGTGMPPQGYNPYQNGSPAPSRPPGGQLDAVTGFMKKLSTGGDQNATGWDRNIAAMAWLPGALFVAVSIAWFVVNHAIDRLIADGDFTFGYGDTEIAVFRAASFFTWFVVIAFAATMVVVVLLAIAYAATGRAMSSLAKNHLVSAANVITTAVAVWFGFGAVLVLPVLWAMLMFLIAIVGVTFTVLYANTFDTDSTSKVLRLVWAGVIVVGMLLTLIKPELIVVGMIPLVVAFALVPLINLVRARLAMAPRCLGLPIMPLLSQR